MAAIDFIALGSRMGDIDDENMRLCRDDVNRLLSSGVAKWNMEFEATQFILDQFGREGGPPFTEERRKGIHAASVVLHALNEVSVTGNKGGNGNV